MKARHALLLGLLSVLFTLWWTNPSEYTDGSFISQHDRQELVTIIYNGSSPDGPWYFYAEVKYGEENYADDYPGRYEWYNAQSELHGKVGPMWDPIRVKN